tara:strand:- start:5195 stop:5368 length:174 start_codon:yes stop_codon:yes gene_type:complete
MNLLLVFTKNFHLPERKPAVGFVLHYLTGVGFALSYMPVWKKPSSNLHLKVERHWVS